MVFFVEWKTISGFCSKSNNQTLDNQLLTIVICF